MDDWEKIKSLVINGEAHNISRKDTDYLEAMPSATSDSMTSQPFGPKARTRKFSFKAGYMHSVIAKLGSEKTNTVSLFKKADKNISLSEKINDKFKPYIGMDTNLIASSDILPFSLSAIFLKWEQSFSTLTLLRSNL